jgi:hypothetical protein
MDAAAAAAAVQDGISEGTLPSVPPVSTGPVDAATLDNLGTPEGSPRHAGGKDKGHKHHRYVGAQRGQHKISQLPWYGGEGT